MSSSTSLPKGRLRARGRAGQSDEADPAVLGRSGGCSKKRAKSSSPRRISTTNCRREASTEGTVSSTRLAHSISSSQTCLHVSSPHVTDAPVYTGPSPINFAIASFSIASSFPSANDTYRCAALLISFPLTPKYGFELPRTSSDAGEPPPPSPASRLRRRWLPRALGEYLGALRMASSMEATTSALRPSKLMLPSGPGISAVVPPDDWPFTSETYAPNAREAPRVAQASSATAATPDAVRTAAEAAAPPKPVKSIISDCASCARKRSPSVGRVPANLRLLSRAASFCALTVGRTPGSSGVTRAAISPKLWLAHDHRGTALPTTTYSRLSGWWPATSATSHTSHSAAQGPQDRFLQPQGMLLA